MNHKKDKNIRIGCCSAFWGDSIIAARQLVCANDYPHYIVADYLAEVTMAILAQRRQKSPTTGGYVGEFVEFVWKPLMHDILNRGIKLVTNAGGLDPLGLKREIERIAHEADLADRVIVAAVVGDDLMASWTHLTKLDGALQPFNSISSDTLSTENDSQENIPKNKPLLSVNAYTGAFSIADALSRGANVVVVGRTVDSALVVGPLIYEYNYKYNDYDRLATASLAGHIIECGCQATGGNFTDWRLSKEGWSNMGYPIVEFCQSTSKSLGPQVTDKGLKQELSFVVTKPENTGGLINRFTVGEQMLYEVLDPANYLLPDVVLDMTQVTLKDIVKQCNDGKSKIVVQVSGAKGKPPTPYYKVSAVYADGYKLSVELMVGGSEACEKAKAVGEAILSRSRRLFQAAGMTDFRATNIELLGGEHTYGPHAKTYETRECIMRLTVHHDNIKALRIMGMEIAPAATCMAPGITGAGSGRPHSQPQMVHVAALVRKEHVPICLHVGDNDSYILLPPAMTTAVSTVAKDDTEIITYQEQKYPEQDYVQVPLLRVCVGRSGDKGDTCNVALLARSSQLYNIICTQVTSQRVQAHLQHLCQVKSDKSARGSIVRRYLVPGVYGLNFVLTQALGGGGLASLRIDRQGKTMAQQLLSVMQIHVPRTLLNDIQPLQLSHL